MKKTLLFVFLWIPMLRLSAQNPICPPGTYIADPTARAWPDGRLYIYGSTDEAVDHWCSYHHDVLSTNDLSKWEMTSNIFVSKGKADSLPEIDPLLYAPDAMYRNGKYYLYFCTPNGRYSEGVATSQSPLGPFGHAQKLNLMNYGGIDPSIFVDDDGQAYYYWGQSTMKGAKMKADMVTIDTASIKPALLNNKDHFFHEGAFVFKRNGIYYAVYADHQRRDSRPTCLGYATASHPLGPFSYRGIIIDNFGCDPESWNNHGSVAQYKGQWYVFYHRSSQGSQVMRRACMEPIRFNADGTIDEVEMTSQGAGAPLLATAVTEAERACYLTGYCRIKPLGKGNEMLGEIKSGDKAAFKYIDFGKGAGSFHLNAAPYTGGTVILHAGSRDGKVIGELIIPPVGARRGFQQYSAPVKKISGVKALWLEFRGAEEGAKLFNIDSFRFE